MVRAIITRENSKKKKKTASDLFVFFAPSRVHVRFSSETLTPAAGGETTPAACNLISRFHCRTIRVIGERIIIIIKNEYKTSDVLKQKKKKTINSIPF